MKCRKQESEGSFPLSKPLLLIIWWLDQLSLFKVNWLLKTADRPDDLNPAAGDLTSWVTGDTSAGFSRAKMNHSTPLQWFCLVVIFSLIWALDIYVVLLILSSQKCKLKSVSLTKCFSWTEKPRLLLIQPPCQSVLGWDTECYIASEGCVNVWMSIKQDNSTFLRTHFKTFLIENNTI